MADIELQFTPTASASDELRAAVETAFATAGLPVSQWTTPADEGVSPSGQRWADPVLTIRVIEKDDLEPSDVLQGELLARLKIAAGGVRSGSPRLPMGVELVTGQRAMHLSFRPDAEPDQVRAALGAVPSDAAASLGWDQQRGEWVVL